MTDNVRSLFTDNPAQMAQVIAGLVQGRPVKEVASSLDIPAGRIARWYRESDEFRGMLEEVTEEVIAEIRSTLVADQKQAVVDLLPKAREVLEEMLDSEKDAVRLQAAAHVFRLAGYDGKHGADREAGAPDQIRNVSKMSPAAGD